MSLPTLGVPGARDPAAAPAGHFGVYRGRVLNPVDPLNMGRTQVAVPAVLGAAEVWAAPAAPLAGPLAGVRFVPSAGDPVLVAFEAGDVAFPVLLGCYWLPGMAPGLPGTHVVRGRAGATIEIGDELPVVTVRTDTGSSVRVSPAGIAVTVGGTSIVLSQEAVAITAPVITITAQQSVTIAAPSITVSGEASVAVSAVQASVTGEAACTIAGAVVKIN